jgi:hypothetical protein
MKKTNNNRIEMKDMIETRKRIGERELAVAELKQVAGGLPSQGGTSSASADTDE